MYERNGQMARTCWITLSGNRWAFSYNYEAKAIDIRSGSIKGPTLFRIDDTTTVAQIHAIVSKL